MTIQKVKGQNVRTPNWGGLSLYIDPVTNLAMVKDAEGNQAELQGFLGSSGGDGSFPGYPTILTDSDFYFPDLTTIVIFSINEDIGGPAQGIQKIRLPALETITGVFTEEMDEAGGNPARFVNELLVLTEIDFRSLVTSTYPIKMEDLPVLQVLNFDSLQSLIVAFETEGLSLLTMPVMESINLPALQQTTAFSVDDCASLTELLVPVLTEVSKLSIRVCPSLLEVNFPALKTVSISSPDGGISVADLDSCTEIKFPALTTIVNGSFVLGTGLPEVTLVDLSALETVDGEFSLSGLSNVESLNLSALAAVSQDFTIESGGFNALFNINSLATVGGNFSIDDIGVSQVNLTGLTSVGGGIAVTNCASLTDISVPASFDTSVGKTYDFQNNALTSGSVNAILAALVAGGQANGFVLLEGGTNASPSGQGLTDVATLEGNGWSVSFNP